MAWKLFPITPGTKVPALAGDWRKHATSDPAQIDAWRAAGYDLGVDCGASNLFVIDIDGEEGERNFLEVAAAQCPPTYSIRTPRGGRHLYYAGVGPSSVGTRVSGLAAKIDTRGQGGYVVWEGPGYELDEAAPAVVAPLPPGMLASLRNTKSRKAAVVDEEDLPVNVSRARAYLEARAPAIEGEGGNDHAYQTAASLRDLGVSSDKSLELMLEIWNDRCIPPWDADELEEVISHAWEYAQNEPGAQAIAGDPRTRFLGADHHNVLQPGRSRYHLWSVTEALTRPKPSFLLPGILPARSIGVVYGPKNIGKTWLVLDQALRLATGLEGFGRDKSDPQDVVYFIGEGFEDLVHSRVLAWCAEHQCVNELPHFHLLENFPDVSNDADVDILGKEISKRELDPRLIVLDTYSRVLAQAGLNENDPVDVMKFVRQAEDLKRGLGCTILAVHHTGKDIDRGPRGAQTLLDAVDFGWEVSGDVELALMARCEKMRAARKGPNMYFEPIPQSGALVLRGITESDYRKLTFVQDMFSAPSIGAALANLNARIEENAVTAYVLARALHQPTVNEPELETNATIDRIARKLSALGKGRLEQYVTRAGWHLPAP